MVSGYVFFNAMALNELSHFPHSNNITWQNYSIVSETIFAMALNESSHFSLSIDIT